MIEYREGTEERDGQATFNLFIGVVTVGGLGTELNNILVLYDSVVTLVSKENEDLELTPDSAIVTRVTPTKRRRRRLIQRETEIKFILI